MRDTVNELLLEREGADAAAHGRNWQSNPYLRREMMPVSTGESLTRWALKHDAWQRGFEAWGQHERPFTFTLAGKGHPGR